MIPEQIQNVLKLFFAYADGRQHRLTKRGLQFSHYTTAAVGSQILLRRDVWMRNASSMNDYSEVTFGRRCLDEGLRRYGDRLRSALEKARPGVFDRILERLKQQEFNHHQHTYLSCLTEHRPNDDLGVLSMWRAYGGPKAGVALIFKPDFLHIDTNVLSAWSSPVIYGEEKFISEFGKLVNSLESSVAQLRAIEENILENIAFNAMHFAVLSTKHVGFREEREWRVIHSPREYASAFVQPTFEIIRGKPEVVYHLPLQNQPGMNLPGLELASLLDRVIIGPCQNPLQVASTFSDILRSIGFTDPDARIRLSHIPLRQEN